MTDVNEADRPQGRRRNQRAAPGAALFLVQDVRDEQRWQEVIAATVQAFGGLHVLVNNAGVVKIATPEDCTLEDFRFQNAVMSEGVFLGCKHAIPAMKASGGGSIINMSSVASHLGYPVYFAYSAAKGAVRSMTKSIAVHCQMNKYNIRCNSIHAGAIDTQMVRDATKTLGMEMSYWEQIADRPRQARGRRQPGRLPRVGRVALRQRHGDPARQRTDGAVSASAAGRIRDRHRTIKTVKTV